MYDAEKIKADIGKQVKIKVANKYRPATLIGVGYRKKDNALMVKARVSPVYLPWSTHAKEIDYYHLDFVRKADKQKWEL